MARAVRKMKETTVANDTAEEDIEPSYGKFDVILTSFCIEYVCNVKLLQYAFSKENKLLCSTKHVLRSNSQEFTKFP